MRVDELYTRGTFIIRKDAFANANRIVVEEDKADSEKGKYIYPKELNMPETLGIGYDEMKKMDEETSRMEQETLEQQNIDLMNQNNENPGKR